MSKPIQLTPAERKQFIEDCRRDLVQKLYDELAEDIQVVSKPRLAGMLDIDLKTLDAMKIKRVAITDRLVKYRLRDVAKHLDSITEK